MLSLIYVSSATKLFSTEELVGLLRQSCQKNVRLGITGLLLYKDGNFMQVLEGPEAAVWGLYRTIANDQRHHGTIMLLQQTIAERQFATWSMGFRNLCEVNLDNVPGYSEFLNEELNSSSFLSNPTRAQKLLLMFRKSM